MAEYVFKYCEGTKSINTKLNSTMQDTIRNTKLNNTI